MTTQDIDILLKNPPNISNKVDVEKILANYGLEMEFSHMGGLAKFISPEIEVEFLIPMKGSGKEGAKRIDEWGIVATPLRYLSFILDYTEPMFYKGIPVIVPEPTVFVLMKYLLTIKRTDKRKLSKDILTAQRLELFLLDNGFEASFIKHFQAMPKKWRTNLLKILEEQDSALFDLLQDSHIQK